MKKMTAFALATSLTLGLLLSGCAMDDPATSGSQSSNGGSGKREVNVCSWGEYIDEDLIGEFEKATGIKVNYTTAESNEALYAKLAGANYDVIVPSDYMISQLIEEDKLAELNYDNIPNFSKIDDRFKNLSYDPENKYTVPYTWGTLGIIYNSTMVDEPITSWDAMFDTKYAGNVLMINNSRDALGIALMDLGYSVNTDNKDELQQAYDLLSKAKSNGVYQGFVMDEVFQKMEQGNYLTMLENNPDLKYVVPEEGSNWFVDAMCVLKDSQHKEEAEEWINFMCSTDACLRNMDAIWYASPNTEALEKYPEYYEQTYGEPLDLDLYAIMAPPQSVLNNCEAYLVRPMETRTLYNDLWTQLGI